MKESVSECKFCKQKDCLVKNSQFSISKDNRHLHKEKKVGSVVNKYIKDAKKELKQQKMERKKESFK